MTATPGKSPKKAKEKKQTPAERQEAMRYNRMMYGPTAGEFRPAARKVAYGSAYLQHPKFQDLMTAFKKGLSYRFEVTDKGKLCPIATDGSHISFDGRVLFYSRPANRFEEHLLLDRTVAVQGQSYEALVHLVFAVIRSLPELEAPPLAYLNRQFHLGAETLEEGIPAQGPNLLIGSFRHSKVQEKGSK